MSAKQQTTALKRYSVYVIGLNRAVLAKRRFIAENSQYNPIKPCVYVGMTGRTPQERFIQHKKDIKACKYVREYGECLKPRRFIERKSYCLGEGSSNGSVAKDVLGVIGQALG